MIVSILDYSSGKVDIISSKEAKEYLVNHIEEILDEKGYDLNNISYMITDKLNLNINI